MVGGKEEVGVGERGSVGFRRCASGKAGVAAVGWIVWAGTRLWAAALSSRARAVTRCLRGAFFPALSSPLLLRSDHLHRIRPAGPERRKAAGRDGDQGETKACRHHEEGVQGTDSVQEALEDS